MKTLKKSLALVLAFVMAFSLMSVASASNFDDYTDADTVGEAYVEAVDVMMGIGVINGMSATEIGATSTFTREQAAKIIAYMTLGAKAAEALEADSAPFTDVAADRWSAGYIAYCVEKGIVSGYGDGKFGPQDTLTGYQFAKMLLGAVGYGANGEYEGNGWAIAVAQDALTKGVFTGDAAAATNSPIQRQQAILMAFNVLNGIERVAYSEFLKQYISVNSSAWGQTVEAVYLADNFNLNDYTVVSGGYNGHIWIIGTTPKADKSNVVSDWYQDDVVVGTEKALSALTKGDLYKNYKFNTNVDVYVNGELQIDDVASATYVVRGSTDKAFAAYAGATAKLVDEDYDGVVEKIMLTIEYLAKVDKVNAETAAASASVELTVYNGFTNTNVSAVVSADDYDISGLAKGDFAIIIPSSNSNAGFNAPASLVKAEAVVAEVDSFTAATVTIDGTAYAYAGNMKLGVKSYDFAPASYSFYIGSNGYILGNAVYVPAASALDYIYVTKVESQPAVSSLLETGDAAVKVKGVLADGTTKVFDYAIKTCTTAGNGLAVGDKYIVSYTGTNNAAEYEVVDASLSNIGAGLYSYTLNDAGEITLSDKVSVTVGTTAYAAATGAQKIEVKAGQAYIELDDTAAYLTTDAKLTVINGAGTATTYTGYANFPGGTAGVTYNYAATATDANDYTAMFYMTKAGLVTDIIVIGHKAATTVEKAILTYAGTSYTAPNAQGVSTVYYNFVTVDGTAVAYPIASGNTAPSTLGAIYAASITSGVADITAIATAGALDNTGKAVVSGTVNTVTDSYIVVGTTVVYLTEAPVYLLKTAGYAADAFVVGDTATVIYSTATATANQLVVGYITTGAATR